MYFICSSRWQSWLDMRVQPEQTWSLWVCVNLTWVVDGTMPALIIDLTGLKLGSVTHRYHNHLLLYNNTKCFFVNARCAFRVTVLDWYTKDSIFIAFNYLISHWNLQNKINENCAWKIHTEGSWRSGLSWIRNWQIIWLQVLCCLLPNLNNPGHKIEVDK